MSKMASFERVNKVWHDDNFTYISNANQNIFVYEYHENYSSNKAFWKYKCRQLNYETSTEITVYKKMKLLKILVQCVHAYGGTSVQLYSLARVTHGSACIVHDWHDCVNKVVYYAQHDNKNNTCGTYKWLGKK